MIPGLVSKISEELIALSTTSTVGRDLVHVTSTTDTTVLSTIVGPSLGGFPGLFILVNRSGNNITTVTTGNIAAARTIPVDMPILFTFSKLTSKWYPGAIS